MGQYFKPVNIDRREYVCPWCIGAGANLWEWAANPCGAIFVMLLRKSTGSGGGDYDAGATQVISLENSTVGRWAGDRVALIGDYDDSNLWSELPTWRNISKEVVRDWNAFMDITENQLEYNPDCSCSKRE